MRILGIESSCDETAIAIVSGEEMTLKVEKSVILSQISTHAKYGGVVPEVAARKHLEAIIPMLKEELDNNGDGIDAIAITKGPGLSTALKVGVEVAKTLAWLWNKPLIPVSHMEGHIYASWLGAEVPELPAVALIVSGGHTELIHMRNHGDYERLGETLDDAAGEAFDKTAKMLGLPYPGGPEISHLAENGDGSKFDFPRGLLNRPNYDFSFSGLKTSVLYMLRKRESELSDTKFRQDVAASIEEAIVDVLVRKTERAVKKYEPKTVLLAGGVAANKVLRKRLVQRIEETGLSRVLLPDVKYTSDNAAMIAAVGYAHILRGEKGIDPLTLKADPNFDFIF